MRKIVNRIKIYFEGVKVFYNDLCFYIKHSNLDSSSNTKNKLLSTMIASYHIVEKGLSMPNRRLGFGKDALLLLITKVKKYIDKYGCNDEQLYYALAIIKEYDVLHKTNNFKLDQNLQLAIDQILENFDVKPAKQIILTREEFFSKVEDNFESFSYSRHSTRHFDGDVSLEVIKEALQLAQNAPSACNKQPMISYIVSDNDKIQKILELQQGNRGYGHLIKKVIVITTKFCGCTRFSDRFYPFVDAGIYTMNVLYSLHYKKIGAIPLIWLSSVNRDNILKGLLDASEEEIPCIIIGIGRVADNVICPLSPRKKLEEVVKVV